MKILIERIYQMNHEATYDKVKVTSNALSNLDSNVESLQPITKTKSDVELKKSEQVADGNKGETAADLASSRKA